MEAQLLQAQAAQLRMHPAQMQQQFLVQAQHSKNFVQSRSPQPLTLAPPNFRCRRASNVSLHDSSLRPFSLLLIEKKIKVSVDFWTPQTKTLRHKNRACVMKQTCEIV